jgi:hypothetical protein
LLRAVAVAVETEHTAEDFGVQVLVALEDISQALLR